MLATTLLSYMTVLNNELSNGVGETDEARCLSALNMAQDLFDALCAKLPVGTLTRGTNEILTIALQEKTPLPASVLRLDGLQPLTGAGGTPVGGIIHQIQETGGHVQSVPWPVQVLLSTSAPGRPLSYWADSVSVYWGTMPDAIYAYRAYGYYSTTDIATRNSTFDLPDICALPLAVMACKLLTVGVGDDPDALDALASQVFGPTLASLKKRIRQRGQTRTYTRIHTT